MTKPKDDFETQARKAGLKTMPEQEEIPVVNQDEVDEEIPAVIENPEDFRMAIGNAQLEDRDYIEVSEKLFAFLTKKSKTTYLTYGDPGIKVFKVGTREGILREEKMNAEDYHNHISHQRKLGNVDKR